MVTFLEALYNCVKLDISNGHKVGGIIVNVAGFNELLKLEPIVTKVRFDLFDVDSTKIVLGDYEYTVYKLHDNHRLILEASNHLFTTPQKKQSAKARKVSVYCCIDENNKLILR